MNKFVLIAFSLALPNIASAASLTETGRLECPQLQNSFECAKYHSNKLQNTHKNLFYRKDQNLLVRLADGKYFTIEDKEQIKSPVEITGNGKYLILHIQHYEGQSWKLLNLYSGYFEKVSGYPLFSPDSKKLVCSEQDMAAGYTPQALDVFEIKSDKFTRVFSALSDKDEWGPGKVAWKDSHTITFVKVRWNENADKNDDAPLFAEEPAAIIHTKGVWKVIGKQ